MNNKCYGCLFVGEYRDMGASTPLCTRCTDFSKAIMAVENTEPCKWFITKSDVKKLQDKGVIELTAKDLSIQSNMKKIAQSVKTATDAMKALTAATNEFMQNIKNGGNQ